VRNTVDRSRHYLLLQSVPLGPYRRDVGIYYKAVSSPKDYSSADIIARDWEGFLQTTSLGSAYSTMIELNDGNIGFLYEEETHCSTRGGGYTIVYKNISVEELTSGKYTFDRKPKLKAFLKR
jgi:sialidase-1